MMTPEERFYKNQAFAIHILKTHFPAVVGDEDMIQEAYIGLWRACTTFVEGKARFSTYAGVCIRNAILMEFRRRSYWVGDVSLDAPLPGLDGLTLADTIEDPKSGTDPYIYDLEKYLKDLNDRDRRLIELRRSGLTQKEVAAEMGVCQAYVCRLEKQIYNKYKERCK